MDVSAVLFDLDSTLCTHPTSGETALADAAGHDRETGIAAALRVERPSRGVERTSGAA